MGSPGLGAGPAVRDPLLTFPSLSGLDQRNETRIMGRAFGTPRAGREPSRSPIPLRFLVSRVVEEIFDGTFPVHYGQAYILSPEDVNSDLEDAFVGQCNGLLGAAVPGQLWLTTGLHTGRVLLRIGKCEAKPTVDDSWEEIVEASFTPKSPQTALTGWAGEGQPVPLELDVASYRIRLCASNMEEARHRDTIVEEDDQIDAYLLVFWRGCPDRC